MDRALSSRNAQLSGGAEAVMAQLNTLQQAVISATKEQ